MSITPFYTKLNCHELDHVATSTLQRERECHDQHQVTITSELNPIPKVPVPHLLCPAVAGSRCPGCPPKLSWNVIIHAENLDVEGVMLQKAIVSRLMDDFAAKKASKNLGYFMSLTTLERIGEGKVQEHTGDVLIPVEFSCVTFKMFRGEILEGRGC
ncbi:hypothetical protein KY285_029141 [Solanum tuberosum]|nr:hypothetical protein KY285_029141 [Solanum tuberosum]